MTQVMSSTLSPAMPLGAPRITGFNLRGSVRRASGFVLTAQERIPWPESLRVTATRASHCAPDSPLPCPCAQLPKITPTAALQTGQIAALLHRRGHTGEHCPKGLVCLGCIHAQPKKSATPIFRRMLASHERELAAARGRNEPAGQIAARELEVARIRGALERAEGLTGDVAAAIEAA